MSRYSSLNSHTQLEQTITDDLKSALEKRGFTVIHNGAWDSHAPGGKPDIVAFDEEHVLVFEVTKSKSAGQDREFQQNSSKEEYERVVEMFKILANAAQRMRQPNYRLSHK